MCSNGQYTMYLVKYQNKYLLFFLLAIHYRFVVKWIAYNVICCVSCETISYHDHCIMSEEADSWVLYHQFWRVMSNVTLLSL